MTLARGRGGRPLPAWGLVAVLVAASPAAAGDARPAVADLLRPLGLLAYDSKTSPPDFSTTAIDGRRVDLRDLRGRVVLVNFWATWCPECRAEMPEFETLHREHAAEGLTILGINVRESRATIERYVRELGLTFPVVFDPKGAIQTAYGVVALPTTFLIGRDGRAIARAIGPRHWGSSEARALIRALLAEPEARSDHDAPERRPARRR